MLAFETAALAEFFRTGTDMESGEAVSVFDLPARDPLWSERPDHVLYFADEETINAYRADADTFPFADHIFRLEKDQLLELEGFADKSAENLLAAIEEAKELPLFQ